MTTKTVVEFRVYDLPVRLPILCLTGDAWHISDVPSARLHFHNCLEIGFCHSHSGYLQFETETVPFEAGDVFFIPRHLPHTTCSSEGCQSRWSYLFVDLKGMARGTALPGEDLADAIPDWNAPIRLRAGDGERLRHLARCMLEEAGGDATSESESLLRLYALAAAVEIKRYISANAAPARETGRLFPLRPALEYVQDHYPEACDTATLAGLCHLSETHFRRLFLSCMGQTPLQFVIATRINQACILLANTSEPILTIAQQVGMPSTSSFNRNFQQVMGISPRRYRSGAKHSGDEVRVFKGWTLPEKVPKNQ